MGWAGEEMSVGGHYFGGNYHLITGVKWPQMRVSGPHLREKIIVNLCNSNTGQTV